MNSTNVAFKSGVSVNRGLDGCGWPTRMDDEMEKMRMENADENMFKKN